MPYALRNPGRRSGGGPVLPRYERVVFEKSLIAQRGKPTAAFICPGHPLLDSVINLTLERHRPVLKTGTVLVDESDQDVRPRILFSIEHAVQDGNINREGERRTISRQVLYVEIDADGVSHHLHYAPYLDYRPLRGDEPSVDAILKREECNWIDLEQEKRAREYAVAEVVPKHLSEVRKHRLALVAKTKAAVKERLTKEITHWDNRAAQLKDAEAEGKRGARMHSVEARRKADVLEDRLRRRFEELKRESQISVRPPVVLGGVLVVPAGLIRRMAGQTTAMREVVDTQEVAARARAIVMEAERKLGFEPTDRETEKLGYDIESRIPDTGKLRFIEVKGRRADADTVTVTRNEVLYSLNKPDEFILAIVEFIGESDHRVHYVRQPFGREPDFDVTSVNYSTKSLIARGTVPN